MILEYSDVNDEPQLTPNEQLETLAHEHAAKLLDEKHATTSESPQHADADDHKLVKTRLQILSWTDAKVRAGWRIVVKVLPVAEQVVKIAKAISDVIS